MLSVIILGGIGSFLLLKKTDGTYLWHRRRTLHAGLLVVVATEIFATVEANELALVPFSSAGKLWCVLNCFVQIMGLAFTVQKILWWLEEVRDGFVLAGILSCALALDKCL